MTRPYGRGKHWPFGHSAVRPLVGCASVLSAVDWEEVEAGRVVPGLVVGFDAWPFGLDGDHRRALSTGNRERASWHKACEMEC